MTLEIAPNLSEEERRILEKQLKEEEDIVLVDPSEYPTLAGRMQAEAELGAFFDSPEGAEARRIWNMPRDEFEDEFADILNADAYDEEDGIDAAEEGA